MGVNGTGYTVVHLDVEFGEGVFLVDGGLLKITNGSLLNHVTDQESLDGLVLGDAAGAVEATYELDVSTSVLVTTVVSSLLSLFCLVKVECGEVKLNVVK